MFSLSSITKILYGILTTAVVALAVLLVLSMVPIQNGPKVKIVSSGSMEPAIRTGSLVIIVPQSSYGVGDVITFGKDTVREKPTTHRIQDMRIESGAMIFRTKGDANEDPDGREIRQSDIIGKVFLSVPYLGYIIDFAKQPLGFFLLVIIPAGAIIIDEIRKIVKEIRGKRREETRI
jgi:signal peptidase